MTRIATLTAVLFLALETFGHTEVYKDVVVVINRNSTISDSIGRYFALQRKIPPQNILYVSSPTTEEITDAQFIQLRQQVEQHLMSNGIADSINYIVTTKGTPLKIKRSDLNANASVESELMLILGKDSSNIGKSGSRTHPYFGQRENFTRKKFGIYLVTRLDGYSFSDVKRMIDRTCHIDDTIPSTGLFLFDQDPVWNSNIPWLNGNMSAAASLLQARGCTVLLDRTNEFITRKENVIGYVSWGSNDHFAPTAARVYHTWMRGGIAETYVSTSGRSFTYPPQYGQSLIADLISEGVTAVKGYVYEPYSSAIANVNTLFDMYSNGYSVAESFYSASTYESWMDVVIGDPKFRLTSVRLPPDTTGSIDTAGNTLPVEIAFFSGAVKHKSVTLTWKTASENENAGFEIYRSCENGSWKKIGFVEGTGSSNAQNEYTFVDRTARGHIHYSLRQVDRNGHTSFAGMIEVNAQEILGFSIDQNYPNPFNPTTTIHYELPSDSRVVLKVFDVLGKEVALLVNESQTAGSYMAQFDASQLNSGVYFYTMQTPQFSKTMKMLLLK